MAAGKQGTGIEVCTVDKSIAGSARIFYVLIMKPERSGSNQSEAHSIEHNVLFPACPVCKFLLSDVKIECINSLKFYNVSKGTSQRGNSLNVSTNDRVSCDNVSFIAKPHEDGIIIFNRFDHLV